VRLHCQTCLAICLPTVGCRVALAIAAAVILFLSILTLYLGALEQGPYYMDVQDNPKNQSLQKPLNREGRTFDALHERFIDSRKPCSDFRPPHLQYSPPMSVTRLGVSTPVSTRSNWYLRFLSFGKYFQFSTWCFSWHYSPFGTKLICMIQRATLVPDMPLCSAADFRDLRASCSDFSH
jgi:hypothetical protein